MNKPISVSSVVNFPEKIWMQNWVVKLMKGEYPAWEKGTTPQEVRAFSQSIGIITHVLIQKELGFTPSPRLLSAANKALLEKDVPERAYHAVDLWRTWYTKEKRVCQGVEVDLSDNELGVSGRCDAVMLEANKKVLYEWKSGSALHESDALELAAYCWLASRKFHYPVVRGLLIHCPYEGTAVRIVELSESSIVKGAATFEALLQAKIRWSDWSNMCNTGLKVGR
jgi:hypothetical protein